MSQRRRYLPPEAERQAMMMDDLWGSLVQIEARHREQVRALTLLHPDAEAAEARRSAAAEALAAERQRARTARKAARSRSGAGAPDPDRIAALRAEVREATAAAKGARRLAREELRPALAELEQARYRAVQDARRWFSARGLYWGSSGAVIDGYEAARQRAMKTGATLRPRNRLGNGAWAGADDARWTVQVQTEAGQEPLRPAGLLGEPGGRRDEQVSLRMTGERRRGGPVAILTVRIRGGRAKGPDGWVSLGEPVAMSLPVILHRPLPPEAQIVRVQVVRRTTAESPRWSACFTLRVPAPTLADPAKPAVGVDLGWRPFADGTLRAAYAVAEDGWSLDVRTPTVAVGKRTVHGKAGERMTLPSGMDLADHLRGRRDQHQNEMQAMLGAWLAARGEDVPDWLRDETEHLALWHSPERLHGLLRHWQRVPGDQEIHAALSAWAARDRHMHRWEQGGRAGWIRRRRDAYRVAAARIAEHASVVVLETFDLRTMAAARPVESDDGSDTALRRVMREAAPGEFRLLLRQACAARGVRVVEVPAEYTTRTCPECQRRYEADFAHDVVVRCPHCGHVHDQDMAAARNLLRRASEPVTP